MFQNCLNCSRIQWHFANPDKIRNSARVLAGDRFQRMCKWPEPKSDTVINFGVTNFAGKSSGHCSCVEFLLMMRMSRDRRDSMTTSTAICDITRDTSQPTTHDVESCDFDSSTSAANKLQCVQNNQMSKLELAELVRLVTTDNHNKTYSNMVTNHAAWCRK